MKSEAAHEEVSRQSVVVQHTSQEPQQKRDAIVAQSTSDDPYEKEIAAVRRERYKKEWDEFSAQVQMAYFAADCKVVTGIISPLINSLYPSELTYSYGVFPHKTMFEVTEDAKRAASARASAPGGCNFWHEHPEAAEAIRRAAEAAFYSLVR